MKRRERAGKRGKGRKGVGGGEGVVDARVNESQLVELGINLVGASSQDLARALSVLPELARVARRSGHVTSPRSSSRVSDRFVSGGARCRRRFVRCYIYLHVRARVPVYTHAHTLTYIHIHTQPDYGQLMPKIQPYSGAPSALTAAFLGHCGAASANPMATPQHFQWFLRGLTFGAPSGVPSDSPRLPLTYCNGVPRPFQWRPFQCKGPSSAFTVVFLHPFQMMSLWLITDTSSVILLVPLYAFQRTLDIVMVPLWTFGHCTGAPSVNSVLSFLAPLSIPYVFFQPFQ